MKKAVLLIFMCVMISILAAGKASGDSFSEMPWLGETRNDERATIANIQKAREMLFYERAPRGGFILAVMAGDEIMSVRVSRLGRGYSEELAIRRITKNGVNSRFEVMEPVDGFVLALRKNVRGRAAIYTPWSLELDSRELMSAGYGYMNAMVDRAYNRLYMRVRSRALPRKSVVEVVPRDIIFTLIFVEHIDGSVMRSGDSVVPFAQKTLVMFGANGRDSFRYSRSRAGARGIGQIMPATYAATRRAYQEARLLRSFLAGTEDHENSVMAMYCLLDSVIANLQPWQRQRLLARGNEMNLGFYLAAAYNAGNSNAQRMFNRYMFARERRRHVARKMYLGKFEAVWNLR